MGHWPSHFKTSNIVVIPKPNKTSFDLPKLYCPIVLLNMIGKLFEKMIEEWLQYYTISNNFIHSSQLGGLKQRFTTDMGVTLTHIIWSGWIKNLTTSTFAFDIAQFFPSLNHQLLPLILDKAGLDCKILTFFKNYLVGRKKNINIFGMISFLLYLTLTSVSVKDLLFLWFFLLSIYLLFFFS